MAAQSTAPPPVDSDPEPSAGSPTSGRFFTWMRALGVTRQPGWIGGVCAGIAARLGIDPLIVRGIVVVVAVLGGPALLLYAAAWLLLPDDRDRIHLEDVTRGRLDSPIAGIGALLLLSLLPVTQGIWYLGASYWGEPSWGEAIGRAVWTLVVLAAIVGFVVWMARQSGEWGAPAATSAAPGDTPAESPATTDDRPETIPQLADASAQVIPPVAPAPPPAGAPAEDVAAWREQQAAWKAEREAFRAQAAASARETARIRAGEARERSAAAAAERAERWRLWTLANPRAGAAYSAIGIGGAAVAGGLASIAVPVTQAVPVGVAVAAGFLGLAVVLAGLLRRRSGFLSFAAGLVLVMALIASALPSDRTLLPLGASYGISNAVPGRYAMPTGNLQVTLDPTIGTSDRLIDVWQGIGTIQVYVEQGITARIEIESRTGDLWLGGENGGEPLKANVDSHGIWRLTTTVGSGTPDVVVHITQERGSITIYDNSHTPTPKTETTP